MQLNFAENCLSLKRKKEKKPGMSVNASGSALGIRQEQEKYFKMFFLIFSLFGTWCFIIQREETARSMFSYKKSSLIFRV